MDYVFVISIWYCNTKRSCRLRCTIKMAKFNVKEMTKFPGQDTSFKRSLVRISFRLKKESISLQQPSARNTTSLLTQTYLLSTYFISRLINVSASTVFYVWSNNNFQQTFMRLLFNIFINTMKVTFHILS